MAARKLISVVRHTPPAAHFIVGEADSTRYGLRIVEDPEGGWLVVAPDFGWAAWASVVKGGEIKPYCRGMSKVDIRNVGAILDATVRT